jgi:hypothetical protein
MRHQSLQKSALGDKVTTKESKEIPDKNLSLENGRTSSNKMFVKCGDSRKIDKDFHQMSAQLLNET